jgi:hypothetical protein
MWPNVSRCGDYARRVGASVEQELGIFSGEPAVDLPYDWRREVSGRPETQYVGSLRTKQVYRPGGKDRVPVADRIFFSRKSDIKKPYKLVD